MLEYLLKTETILAILGMLNFVYSRENSNAADDQFNKALANISETYPKSWKIMVDSLVEKSFRLNQLEDYGDTVSYEEAIVAGLPKHLAEASKREIKEKKSGIFEFPEGDTFVPDFPSIQFVIFKSNYTKRPHILDNIPGSQLVYVYGKLLDYLYVGNIVSPANSMMSSLYHGDNQRCQITLFDNTPYYVLAREVHFKEYTIVRGVNNTVVNTLREYNNKIDHDSLSRFREVYRNRTLEWALEFFCKRRFVNT